jgi:hypothetical protein
MDLLNNLLLFYLYLNDFLILLKCYLGEESLELNRDIILNEGIFYDLTFQIEKLWYWYYVHKKPGDYINATSLQKPLRIS